MVTEHIDALIALIILMIVPFGLTMYNWYEEIKDESDIKQDR